MDHHTERMNNKLGKLRKQRYKLYKPHSVQSDCLVRKATSHKSMDVEVLCQALHESLQDSWSRMTILYTAHQAKLSVKAKTEYGNLQLDMVKV
jgi:hypothetical protein